MILGITPARGGSKGIHRKNIKKIYNKHLISWTIESAKKSKLLDRYVVSTEDSEIAKICMKYNVDVIDRPKELSTDKISTLSVIQHVLTIIDADVIVLLQCTSPIRDDDLIDECIKKFKETKSDSLATGFICKYLEYGKCNLRRQDINGFFYDDGNVYVIKSDIIKKGNRFGNKIEKIVLNPEQNIDIDNDFDFWLAEQILKKRDNYESINNSTTHG